MNAKQACRPFPYEKTCLRCLHEHSDEKISHAENGVTGGYLHSLDIR